VPRDTSTGAHYKEIVGARLNVIGLKKKFDVLPNVEIGLKPGGQVNRVPFVIVDKNNDDLRGIVSCKIQTTGGSAEEKVAFEIIKLLVAMRSDRRYRHAWLILGGSGWTPQLLDFYKDEMDSYIPRMRNRITILRTDDMLTENFNLK
jgi:hypothetical protein